MLFRGRSKYNWKEIFIKYGSRLASLSNPTEVYKTLLNTLTEISGAEGAGILLFDSEVGQFTLIDHLGPQPLSFSIPANHPLILWLRRDGRPLSRKKLVTDPKFVDLRSSALTFYSEFNTEITFPLIAEKKFLGLLNLGSKSNADYDSEDLEILGTLISLGSVFIENSRHYEALVKQNNKLSELARLKTHFVSNITHELRTPLHGILGLADVILEDTESPLAENQRRYLEMMKHSGEELLEVVDHILDLTKYQSGMVQLDIHKLDLKNIFETTISQLEDHFKSQQCKWKLEWPEDTPWVYGDEKELKHLVLDLLENALKFSPGGEIIISSQKTGDMLKVCVRDTGIGIDEKEQETIFEEFRQADRDVNRKQGGPGLGLALAKKILDLHGGRIWVESKKDAGSYFYFTLPINPSRIENRMES